MQIQQVAKRSLQRPDDALALQYHHVWYPWGWLRQLADRIQTALRDEGIASGARVGVIARNQPAFVGTLLGLIADGDSIVMIYAWQAPAALADEAKNLNLHALIGDEADWSAELLSAAQSTGILGLSTQGTGNTVRKLTSWVQGNCSLSSSPAVDILTSGTTGRPKRIRLDFNMIARSMLGESSLTVADTSKPPALIMFPFGNIAGLYSYLPTLQNGQPIVLLDKFSVEAWADFVREYRPQYANLPTAAVSMILDADLPAADLASIRYVASGASSLDPSVQAAFLRRYGIPVLLSYGATEFGGVVTSMTPQLYEQYGPSKLNSVGRVWGTNRVRVVDAGDGHELAASQLGTLEVLAPRVCDNWTRTTDLASIDSDGFVYHRGRADGAIMRGGHKILPELVAEKLALHPSIAFSAVVGIPDGRLGEIPVAAVELRPGRPRPSVEELVAHARRHLGSTHIPVHFRIVEALPRTPSMKVYLPGVKALFADLITQDALLRA